MFDHEGECARINTAKKINEMKNDKYAKYSISREITVYFLS